MHRVLAPTGVNSESELTPRRQSIAFFCNPNANTLVECLSACVGTGAKYPAVRTEDYLVQRLVYLSSKFSRLCRLRRLCPVSRRLIFERATSVPAGRWDLLPCEIHTLLFNLCPNSLTRLLRTFFTVLLLARSLVMAFGFTQVFVVLLVGSAPLV